MVCLFDPIENTSRHVHGGYWPGRVAQSIAHLTQEKQICQSVGLLIKRHFEEARLLAAF